MSFLGIEASVFFGEPVELYKFTRGPEVWRFTSSKRAVVFNGEEYLPGQLKRSNIRSTADFARQKLTIECPASVNLVTPYLAGMPALPTKVQIWRKHVGETEVGALWGGRVTGVKFAGEKATIEAEPLSSMLKRIGLRAQYQVICRHILYDPETCKAKEVPINGTIAAMSASTNMVARVTLNSSIAAGKLKGGKLKKGDYIYMITKHSIDADGRHVLTLSSAGLELAVGDAIKVSKGCEHTPEACQKDFNNYLNYGGFPFIPDKNPFRDGPVA